MIKDRKVFLKLSKLSKKWLINVSKEPNVLNTTLDNGGSLKHFFSVLVVFSVSSYSKNLKICKFKFNTKLRFVSCLFQY